MRADATFQIRRVPDDAPTLRLLPSPDATVRMPGAPELTIKSPPTWIGDIKKKYRLRVTDWITQSWQVTHSPMRFMEDWATGRREVLNPLRFMAVGTALKILLSRGGRALFHIEEAPMPTAKAFWHTSIGITVSMLAFGAMLHCVLRWKSGAPIRSSIAAVLYATAGPGAFLAIAAWLVTVGFQLISHKIPLQGRSGDQTPWPLVIAGVSQIFWIVTAIMGAHRVRWWWAILALLATPILLSLVLGVVVAVIVLVMTQLHIKDSINLYI